MKRILLVVGLITWSFFSFAQEQIQLKDIWSQYKFYPRGVSGISSLSNGTSYTTLKNGKDGWEINKFAYATGEQESTILSQKQVKESSGESLKISSYSFNQDESKILLTTNAIGIYRHSSKAVYYAYDLTTNKLEKVSDDHIMYATFSPIGDKIAYVFENNIYLKELSTGWVTQITSDGKKNEIINGALDWVYEEEFSFSQGFYWSAEGNFIAFYRFDETAVPTFSMDVFGKGLYPTQDVFKYPKAGEVNSKVTAHIYNVTSGETTQALKDVDYEYLPRIKWTRNDEELVVYAMNRHQNELNLYKVNANSGNEKVWLTETDEAYVEITDDIRFLEDGSFIWTSEKDGYNHLYHYRSNGKLKRQITKGKWDVTTFYGIDEANNTLYYQSAEVHPTQRQVYRIGLNGKGKTKLTNEEGWNSATFSNSMAYFIHNFSHANKVPTVILRDNSGAVIRELEMNENLSKTLEKYQISEKEFLTAEVSEGVSLNGWMIKPTNFDSNKKYPVLMFVYGGPGSQTVKNSYDGFNDKWYQILADKGYIVVSFDNRGTGARGRDFKKVTYKELGKYEIEDQIAAARYLSNLDYIDSERIGIWGWSFGGYMSSLGITKGHEVFKAAIAVAPVTNWRFYDNIYTERYMQTPQENASGYDENSPINHVGLLEGSYLLVHGSADDNVHVQNTMRMIESLVQANKQFDLFIYPDKNHGIFGGNTRYHLYEKMTRFIEENL